MSIAMGPDRPSSSPPAESGTTASDNDGVSRSSVPFVLHEETARATFEDARDAFEDDLGRRPSTGVAIASMRTTLFASSGPWNRLSIRKRPASTPSPRCRRAARGCVSTRMSLRPAAWRSPTLNGAHRGRSAPMPGCPAARASARLRASRIPMPAGPVSRPASGPLPDTAGPASIVSVAPAACVSAGIPSPWSMR